MYFDEMIRKEMKTSEFSEMESTDEIIEKIRENTLNSLEEQTEFMKHYPNPTYAVMRLTYLSESEEQGHFEMLLDLLQGEEADRTPDGHSETSDRVYENREAEADGSLEYRGRERSAVQGDDFSTERIDHQGSSGNLKENTEVEIREAEKASFTLPEKAYGQIKLTIPLSEKDIDAVLINGGNHDGGRLPIIAEFFKEKTVEELGEYLKDTFKSGNGLYIDEKEVFG